jgi:hypothetical protein
MKTALLVNNLRLSALHTKECAVSHEATTRGFMKLFIARLGEMSASERCLDSIDILPA